MGPCSKNKFAHYFGISLLALCLCVEGILIENDNPSVDNNENEQPEQDGNLADGRRPPVEPDLFTGPFSEHPCEVNVGDVCMSCTIVYSQMHPPGVPSTRGKSMDDYYDDDDDDDDDKDDDDKPKHDKMNYTVTAMSRVWCEDVDNLEDCEIKPQFIIETTKNSDDSKLKKRFEGFELRIQRVRSFI